MGRKNAAKRDFVKSTDQDAVASAHESLEGHSDQSRGPFGLEQPDDGAPLACCTKDPVGQDEFGKNYPDAQECIMERSRFRKDCARGVGFETKGQLLQFHKRELKELKSMARRAGKKGKEQFNEKLCQMLQRQQQEVTELEHVTQDPSVSNVMQGRAPSSKADGNCMYRAVAHQCSLHGISIQVQDVAPSRCHQALRAMAASYIRLHSDDFIPFMVAGNIPGEELRQIESFCAGVLGDEWGSHLELHALSASLEVHIQVFSADCPPVDMGESFIGAGPLQICYLKHAYSNGHHYNSIIPLEKTHDDFESEEYKQGALI